MMAVMGAALITSPSNAQMRIQPQPCPGYAQHDVMKECLKKEFNEHVIWEGLAHNGIMIELYSSTTGQDTWTIVVTNPNGNSQIKSSGTMNNIVDPSDVMFTPITTNKGLF